ncbi:MAG: tetratricopeptide repeat protein [Polynucleobacter sp.]|uniref:tetratricopeptide repeat protein n=1 Tax=Polynucleobacter sp. TaxID=2029855 RepID=UPI0027232BF2|nr:tetratricopeptide repeat protein [Polynucleobacter sp.]MDO8715029.1 tetratricopeptide repeat protein [Polynucleobacter sp.]
MNSHFELMLQQAIQAFQEGGFDRASSILTRLLQVDPKSLPALHILGLIKASQERYKEAAELLARAAKLNPNEASIQYNLAKALMDNGSYHQSIPHHKKAVQLASNNPEAWLNYGKTVFNLGCYQDAIVNYDRALSLNPDYAEAYLNKGASYKELKRYEEALEFAEKALSINPNLAQAWSNKGVVLKELQQYEEAIHHFDKALSLKPDYPDAWINKGAILFELKRYDEALRLAEKALEINPNSAEAWSNKGLTLKELQRYEEAIHHFDKALSLKPDYSQAWTNKAGALYELKRYDEAIVHYEKALILRPDIDYVHEHILHTEMKMCNWIGFDKNLENILNKTRINKKAINPFTLLALVDDGSLSKQCSEIYIRDKYPPNLSLGKIPKASKREKIRIGYFSADFRHHAVSILTAELYELHDKNKFEIIAFTFGADDKSPMRERLNKSFNQFIDVTDMPDKAVAKLARDLGVDIAVDLGGFTAHSRTGIFAYRAAPIQVSYIGYLGTMGSEYIDYLVADRTIIPLGSEHLYAEKIIYLPSYQVNDRKRVISDKRFTRQELGLPDNSFVFSCFNANFKILPSTFDGWMRILKAVESSVLLLYAETHWAEANLRKEAEARGVSGHRLVFSKFSTAEEYLARYRACDLFLDTVPYNAGTTASDALWAGLPVLTLMGNSFASRVAASLLNAIELPELITETQEAYEATAIDLALNPQKLIKIRQKLAENRLSAALFDTPLFVKSIEAAYCRMMNYYWADLPPEHIHI